MISSEIYEKYTGVAITATIDETVAALTALIGTRESNEVGECFLCDNLRNKREWLNTEVGVQYPHLSSSAITRNAARGAILMQCDEKSLTECFASLVPMSNDRVIQMNLECSAIQGDENVSAYVVKTCRAELVAKIMQSTQENHEILCRDLISKGISKPSHIRKVLPAMADARGISMPKRSGAASSSADDKANTAPTVDKAFAAVQAFVADRKAGTDEGEMFEVSADEMAALTATINTGIDTLLAAQCFEAVAGILITAKSNLARAKKDAQEMADHADSLAADRAAGAAVAADLKANAMGVRANA